MKATGYVGDAFPGMTFGLQVPLLPIIVNTSFFSVALPNLCSCCFQVDTFSESILNVIIWSFCVDVDE